MKLILQEGRWTLTDYGRWLLICHDHTHDPMTDKTGPFVYWERNGRCTRCNEQAPLPMMACKDFYDL